MNELWVAIFHFILDFFDPIRILTVLFIGMIYGSICLYIAKKTGDINYSDVFNFIGIIYIKTASSSILPIRMVSSLIWRWSVYFENKSRVENIKEFGRKSIENSEHKCEDVEDILKNMYPLTQLQTINNNEFLTDPIEECIKSYLPYLFKNDVKPIHIPK